MAKITRAGRRRLDAIDAAHARERNAKAKSVERRRRRTRMLGIISGASLPYPPHVMSWLSRELGKPSSRITQEDVKALVN